MNDFSADAIISQLLLLDAQDPTKVLLASAVGRGWRGDVGRPACLPCTWPSPGNSLSDKASTSSRTPPPLHRTSLPRRLPSPSRRRPPAPTPQDIKMFINSPGGSVTAGMGIYDAMLMCRADIQTYCFGLAASMGAFLLGAGAAGKRYSMPNARIMIHQPLGGASGAAVDIEIQAKEIMYHKANLNRIMAGYTGQAIEKVRAGAGGRALGGAGRRVPLGAHRSLSPHRQITPLPYRINHIRHNATSSTYRRLRRTPTATATCHRLRPRPTA